MKKNEKDRFIASAGKHMDRVEHLLLGMLITDRHENLPHLSNGAASAMHAAAMFGVLRHICAPEWLASEAARPEHFREYSRFTASLSKEHLALVKKLHAWRPGESPEVESPAEAATASCN